MPWYVGVWDLWFLLWGILLALATVGYWRRRPQQRKTLESALQGLRRVRDGKWPATEKNEKKK